MTLASRLASLTETAIATKYYPAEKWIEERCTRRARQGFNSETIYFDDFFENTDVTQEEITSITGRNWLKSLGFIYNIKLDSDNNNFIRTGFTLSWITKYDS
jgi:hypothetical protein